MRPDPPAPIVIPDDFTVYAIADLHGVYSGFEAVAKAAGLISGDGLWAAPSGTALVVLGDTIDRGTRPLSLLRYLAELRIQASAGDSVLVLLDGNHEQMARDGMSGNTKLLDIWLSNGGRSTLAEIGIGPGSRALRRDSLALRSAVDRLARDFRPLLGSLAPYARWRDICFVHAGWPQNTPDMEWFAHSNDRLWVRQNFLGGPPLSDPVYAAFAYAGLRRVVIGHTPDGPVISADGSVLLLDSNIASAPGVKTPAQAILARLPDGGPLSDCVLFSLPMAAAPDRQPAGS